MAASHDVLRRATSGRAERWDLLRAALRHVTAAHSAESEKQLRGLLSRDFRIRLKAGSSAPHAMSPEDMLRSEAIQALARWDRRKHRKVIALAARRSTSSLVAEIARAAVS